MKAISGRDIEVLERHGFHGLTRIESAKICAIRVKVRGKAAEGRRSPRREAFAWDSRIARSVLECAGFSGAVERAENLERWMISVRTKSGAEVTAVQTLRVVERVTPCAPSEVSTMRMEHGSLSRSVLECAGRAGAATALSDGETHSIVPSVPQSGVALRLPPQSKTRGVCLRLTNCAKRPGVRQPSGAFGGRAACMAGAEAQHRRKRAGARREGLSDNLLYCCSLPFRPFIIFPF